MEFTITSAMIAVVAVLVFLFIAKRVLRLAIRLLLVGVVMVALLGATAWGWWHGWIGSTGGNTPPRPAATRRPTPR